MIWRLCVINTDKTKMITLSSNRKKDIVGGFSFVIDGHSIKSSEFLKCLGITFDTTLTWSRHVENISKACFIRIRALYTIRKYITTKQMQYLCQSYVLSIVNYMIQVYGVASQSCLKIVNKVVRTLARLVLNVRKYDPVLELIYTELEWMLPVDACVLKTLCCFYKIHKLKSVDFFRDYYKDSFSVRRNNVVSWYKPRSETGKKVFQYRATVVWNELPKSIKDIESYALFKKTVKKHLISKLLTNRILQL